MLSRKRIFDLVDETNKSNRLNFGFDIFLLILILLNVVAIVLESFEEVRLWYSAELHVFEVVSVILFTIEYLFRAISSKYLFPGISNRRALVRFIFSPLALVDLFAILPFYLPIIFSIDLRLMRLLRMLRIIRIFKLKRYSSSLTMLVEVVKEERNILGVTFFIMIVLLVICASVMYHVEHLAQPEAFPNIVAALWWAVATLTTVGYGDIVPITGWGKIISAFTALIGIGMFALPTGILCAAFIRRLNRERANTGDAMKRIFCPHCGHVVRFDEEEESGEPHND